MIARTVIEQIEALPAEEQAKVVKYLEQLRQGSGQLTEQRDELERKVSALQTRLEGVLGENNVLKSELSDREQQLDRLKDKIHEGKTGDRSDIETSILLFLVQNGSATITSIASHIGKDLEVAKYHLQEMELDGFTRFGQDQRDSYYLIEQAGRRYLNQRGLLK